MPSEASIPQPSTVSDVLSRLERERSWAGGKDVERVSLDYKFPLGLDEKNFGGKSSLFDYQANKIPADAYLEGLMHAQKAYDEKGNERELVVCRRINKNWDKAYEVVIDMPPAMMKREFERMQKMADESDAREGRSLRTVSGYRTIMGRDPDSVIRDEPLFKPFVSRPNNFCQITGEGLEDFPAAALAVDVGRDGLAFTSLTDQAQISISYEDRQGDSHTIDINKRVGEQANVLELAALNSLGLLGTVKVQIRTDKGPGFALDVSRIIYDKQGQITELRWKMERTTPPQPIAGVETVDGDAGAAGATENSRVESSPERPKFEKVVAGQAIEADREHVIPLGRPVIFATGKIRREDLNGERLRVELRPNDQELDHLDLIGLRVTQKGNLAVSPPENNRDDVRVLLFATGEDWQKGTVLRNEIGIRSSNIGAANFRITLLETGRSFLLKINGLEKREDGGLGLKIIYNEEK